MSIESKLAKKIAGGEFIITAEHLPIAAADGAATEAALKSIGSAIAAVNVADNHHGVAMSSLAASVAAIKAGVEPVYQMVTRDANRIGLQSNLLGAAYLGIRNVLCISGYHQTLVCQEAANAYDVDSTQLIKMVTDLTEKGVLADGKKIAGQIQLLAGAVANPYMEPLELNIIKLGNKIAAGAKFIQTHAVFDTEKFGQWLSAAKAEGLTGKTAILAGVLPLVSAAQAEELRSKYTDLYIGDEIVKRLSRAGNEASQKKEGIAICVEIIKKIKGMAGLRGIHILSGGNEAAVPEIMAAAGL